MRTTFCWTVAAPSASSISIAAAFDRRERGRRGICGVCTAHCARYRRICPRDDSRRRPGVGWSRATQMRRLYNLLVRLAAPVAFGVVLARGFRDRGYWQGLRERFGFGSRLQSQPSIWLHAVSLGEVSAAAPIVRELLARYPQIPIVVTTATPTGRARALGLFGDRVDVRFLPYDLPGAVQRFLDRVMPTQAIIMETELWPNLYRECARRALPLLLASARLSAKSVSRYRRFGNLFSGLFSPNVLIGAQTSMDARRFEQIGADPARIQVVGNVKFDVDVGANVIEQGLMLRQRNIGVRPVWAAGSTHEGEDEQVLDAHARVCAQHAIALLILAPRHSEAIRRGRGLARTRGLALWAP